MGVYVHENIDSLMMQSYRVTERSIYGSDRMGLDRHEVELIAADSVYVDTFSLRNAGNKHYELKNHLGNVLTTVSDRKIHHPITTSMYFELSDLEFTDLFKIDQDPQTGVLTSQPGGGGSSCGAASTYNLSGDGYIEWNVGNVTIDKNIFVGLSYSNYSSTYDMDYSWYISNGPDAYIFENSGLVGSAYSINDGDILKIERDGSLIKYYKNGTLVRTITESGTGNLLIDISMLSVGKQIQDLVLYDPNADYAYYTADQISYSDYYPFGMQLPNRNGNTDKYRYGFNGMEKDDEVKGVGNSYTTHFRQYDPRLGRWLSIDPKASSMPWQSPYTSMDNNPILYNDPLGDKIKVRGGLVFRIATRFRLMRIKMMSSKKVRQNIKELQKDKNRTVYITNKFTRNNKKLPGGFLPTPSKRFARIVLAKGSILKSIFYPGKEKVKMNDGTEHQEIITGDPLTVLTNEMSHALDWYNDRQNDITVIDKISGKEETLAEFESNEFENKIRAKQGKPLRFVDSHVGGIAPNKRIARKIAEISKITDPKERAIEQKKLEKKVLKKE